MKSPILAPLIAAALLTLGLAGCDGSAGGEPGRAEGARTASGIPGLGSPVEVARGEVQDPHVAIDDENGKVYVAWAQNDSGMKEQEHEHGEGGEHAAPPEKNAYLAVSDDGGETFSEPVRVNRVEGEVFAGGNTSPKVTPAPGEEVIVSWTRSRPFSEVPELASRGRDYEGSQYSFRMARSTDGGRTFGPATEAVNDGEVTSESYQTIHAADDGRTYAAWIDYRGSLAKPADEGIGLRTAVSGSGQEFSPSQKIDALSCECCDTAIASDSTGAIYLAYRDQDEEGQTREELKNGLTVRDSVVVKSTDGGESWSEPVALHDDGWEFNQCPEAGPDISVDGEDNLHGAYYTGKESGPGVYYVRSTDEGASFDQPVTLMKDGFFPPATVALAADDGGTAWVAWDDSRRETPRVHLARITPDGERRTSENLATGLTPSIAAAGDSVVAVWAEEGALKALSPGTGG